MPFYYYDWTMILVIPGLLLGLYAQFKVKSTFDRYSRVRTRSGLTAEQAARMLLSRGGSANVTISRVNGSLTDHYDPRSNTLRLSDSVYGSDSVAAVGVAAHECGHALQEHDGYGLLKLRSALVPVVNIGSSLYLPIFMAGLLFSWEPLQMVGILCFGLTLLFSLVTLPVEINASKRALGMLDGVLEAEELQGAKAVLSAAALTYLASVISSALQLLRLILISRSRNRD
ncbi:MAG: zinc metallopeptidase [Candidatus Limiplasma sp.]|jgi:Zn-dependent membrane protease YugP|nr:zinc metallopeptidase [Clostridiales bacterium]MDY3242784.1 zinc metallopeptidase [Candidatus Limiplasma sp.]